MRLTNQRNVDLTLDGLWAKPLNSGWVPVKSRRLQDWQKLKKYVVVMSAQMGCQLCLKQTMQMMQRFGMSECEMFIACLRADFAALVLKNVTTYPRPPNPYISEMAFSHRFQKVYTYPPPPPMERIFGALDK